MTDQNHQGVQIEPARLCQIIGEQQVRLNIYEEAVRNLKQQNQELQRQIQALRKDRDDALKQQVLHKEETEHE